MTPSRRWVECGTAATIRMCSFAPPLSVVSSRRGLSLAARAGRAYGATRTSSETLASLSAGEGVMPNMAGAHELTEVSSRVYPGLDRKAGDSNWVDRAGGLPGYI